MIKNIVTAIAGKNLAKTTSGIGGPLGTALGLASMTVLRRASVPTMIAIAAGGYAWKKYSERQSEMAPTRPTAAPTAPTVKPTAI